MKDFSRAARWQIDWPFWASIPLFLILPFVAPYIALATNILVFGIFAMAFNLLLGYTGLLSFGHGSFFGLGAYFTGLLLVKANAPLGLAMLGGVLAATLGGLVIGYISLKRRDVYFAMITMAFSQLLFFLTLQLKDLTGGDNGLAGIPILQLPFSINLGKPLHTYYFTFVFFILSVYAIRRLLNSPFGKAIQAIRENENRAISCGFNAKRIKLISFILSGMFSGLAGVLYCIHLRFVPIETLSITTNSEVIFISIIGGLGTFWGPIVGSATFLILIDVINKVLARWEIVVGLIFILFILFLNRGICGLVERLMAGRRQRLAEAGTPQAHGDLS
jgi:branched-chain amino acid transport system permease protein